MRRLRQLLEYARGFGRGFLQGYRRGRTEAAWEEMLLTIKEAMKRYQEEDMAYRHSTDQFQREDLVAMIATLRGALAGLLHGDSRAREDAIEVLEQTTMTICDTDLLEDGRFSMDWTKRARPDIAAFDFNLNRMYHERAVLLSLLTKSLQASSRGCRPRKAFDREQSEPWTNLVVFDTPDGQVSWHIAKEDIHLFDHLEVDYEWSWDGHTTEEKQERLLALKDDT